MYKYVSVNMLTLLGILITGQIPVADPGFPQGEGANSPGGAPTYNFALFSQKLHEIERIWAPRAPL